MIMNKLTDLEATTACRNFLLEEKAKTKMKIIIKRVYRKTNAVIPNAEGTPQMD